MSAYLAAVLADAPVHYWRCTDPGGILLNDIGSLRRALLVNSTYPAGSPYIGPVSDGGALIFQGGAYPWYKDTTVWSTPFSLECWAWQQATAGVAQYLMEIAGPGAFGAGMFLSAAGVPTGQAPGAGNAVTAAATPTIQHWHHYVLSVNAAGVATLYVDAFAAGSVAGTAAVNQNYALAIAGLSTSPAGTAFSGLLSECALYNTALSPSRVTTHFTAADQISSQPVFKGNGSVDPGTGVPTLISDEIAQILASVRRTLP